MPTKEDITAILKQIHDPEVQVDIWTMGLIYNIEIDDKANTVNITMTLTTPTCPYGPMLLEEIRNTIKDETDADVDIEVTFDPPWEPSEELRMMLGV